MQSVRNYALYTYQEYNSGMDATWLTVEEGVRLSGYHPDHLRRLIRAGDVVAVKKGNAWWVQHDSLAAYLNAARQSDDKRRGPKLED